MRDSLTTVPLKEDLTLQRAKYRYVSRDGLLFPRGRKCNFGKDSLFSLPSSPFILSEQLRHRFRRHSTNPSRQVTTLTKPSSDYGTQKLHNGYAQRLCCCLVPTATDDRKSTIRFGRPSRHVMTSRSLAAVLPTRRTIRASSRNTSTFLQAAAKPCSMRSTRLQRAQRACNALAT
jgi:hypothetical protein